MTWRPYPIPSVPEATAAAVKAAFPKGNLYVDLHTELGAIYDDTCFADFYAERGHPVDVAPWRLALVTVMQYIEGLTDRQSDDAVRRCMDWKYALSLELTDAGFDFTLLHDFRQRLLLHDGAQRLLDTLLDTCKARGWIKTRGKQRTDSTYVVAAIRRLYYRQSDKVSWACMLSSYHPVRPMIPSFYGGKDAGNSFGRSKSRILFSPITTMFPNTFSVYYSSTVPRIFI